MPENKTVEKNIEKPQIETKTIKPKYKQPTMKSLLEKIQALESKLEEKEKVKIKAPPAPENTVTKMERLRLRDRELVVGTFRNHDVEGGHIKFDFHKWDGDPVEKFMLIDGHRYALPRGVATHLRDSGKFVSYPGSTDLENPVRRSAVISNRYSFERDDFGEDVDMSKISRGYAPKNAR